MRAPWQPLRSGGDALRLQWAKTRFRPLCRTNMTFSQIAGILPAIVFPVATLAQLVRMLRARSSEGVCVSVWALFGFANLGIYAYAERYTEWQAIVGMLLTALLDFIIVGVALFCFKEPSRATRATELPHVARADA